MIWKPVKDFEGMYEVSDTGLIKSLARSNGHGSRNEDKQRRTKIGKGYESVALCKDHKIKHYLVHRVVAEAFIPNPKNHPQVNHIDGNKLNNNVENLEWCTHQYNQLHARQNGLMGGERGNTSKLTERDVRAIRRIYPKLNTRELAKAFDVGQPAICNIINKKTWKYVK